MNYPLCIVIEDKPIVKGFIYAPAACSREHADRGSQIRLQEKAIAMDREKFMVIARLKSGEEVLVFKVEDTRAVAETLAAVIRDALTGKTIETCFVRAVQKDDVTKDEKE